MLGENILKLRKKTGLSQEDLSELVGVTRQTISNWELNETSPNPEQLKKLSQALKVSIDDLVNNDMKNILEEKIVNTEILTKKHLRFTKIIFATLYFLILLGSIAIIIYFVTKKDLTDYYQTDFTCTMGSDKYYFTLTTNDEGKSVIGQYMNDEKEISEEYLTGESINDQIESLNVLKKIIISQGGKCR